MRISDHERAKKELLSLDYAQVLILSFLSLQGWKSSKEAVLWGVHAVAGTTKNAVNNHLVQLGKSSFAIVTQNDVRISPAYRVIAFFATDALKPADRERLLDLPTASERQEATRGRRPRRWYYGNYADQLNQFQLLNRLAMLAIHQDDPAEFQKRYHQLVELQERNEHYAADELQVLRSIFATVDARFWERRDVYFSLQCLGWSVMIQENWSAEDPIRLAPLLRRALREDYGHHEYLQTFVLAAWGHYQNDAEIINGIQPAAYLRYAQRSGAPGQSSTDQPAFPVPEEDVSASMLLVLAATQAYAAGVWTLEEYADFLAPIRVSIVNLGVQAIRYFALHRAGNMLDPEAGILKLLESEPRPLDWLGILCACAWLGIRPPREKTRTLIEMLDNKRLAAAPWVAGQLTAALNVVVPRRLGTKARAQVQSGEWRAVDLFPPEPVYKSVLRRLRGIGGPAGEDTNAVEPEFRTIWIINFSEEIAYAKEQKKGKRGWSKGRKIKFTDFLYPGKIKRMEEADQNVIGALTTYDGRRLNTNMGYGEDSIYVNFNRLIYELADHPRLYVDEKRRIPIQVERREPELTVEETDTGLAMHFDPPANYAGYTLRQLTPTRYYAYQVTAEHVQLSTAIQDGVEIPNAERDIVEHLVERFRPIVQVQSTFDLLDEDLEVIQGDHTPTFHLLPYDEAGYQVALFVRPVPEGGYYFRPGEGQARSLVVLEDGRRLLERDLPLERDEAAAAILECPTLARTPHTSYEWLVEDTRIALRILLEIRKLVGAEQARIEHPKGEKLRLVGQAQLNDLDIKVAKSRDWFEIDGAVRYDEDRVLSLERLLTALRENQSDFIQLGENEFVAITDELRDKVLEMEGLLHQRGKKLQLPTLAAGAFVEVAGDLEDIEYDAAWQDSLDRIAQASKIRPRVPKSFNATLRPYQQDGYKWMMRLAAWGVGGCLADDMGLGKTVQALALLTARADQGPSLVIAPASVTRNWRRETEKFSPGLVPVLIASTKEVERLDHLGNGDLAIVSFGLLPFIGEALTHEERRWNTIVIDEAQAIKNAATKRAKIVQNLSADFKLATTGTPIENHLGELWSLFRFLNPGLLGSKKSFNEKYNRPIAQHGNEQVRQALQRLVQPFILRRRKDEVLKELPAKTEVVLEVQLSDEEQALYEAMRRQALKEIEKAAPEERHFRVLAELTRLRQAACNPRLVRKHSKVPSAKLQLVSETIVELLANGHKALVFSQFVKHLKIVEEWVRDTGIPYQYLDGSTPGKKREEHVQAFQNGQGKLFLISLKAGGTGLNLTAADYVLHLDPWWNPAAEDQASDRAHRIGQRRPVTVYRFVSQGTIEEQIIALHAEKRDLADQILSGTGKAGSLSVEEIVNMLREE